MGLAAGTDGLIRRSDLQPVATTVAVLDPVSCRVISEIALGAEAHVFVDIDTAGQVDTHPYDPSDYGTWPNIGALLPDAPQCASADPDPSSTAAPTPSVVDGVRLEPGAIDCQIGPEAGTGPDASTEPFDVRVEFVVGAVGGCVARDDDIRPGSADRSAVTIWNPDNDLHRLALAWDGTGCTVSATVSLAPTLAGYRADVISIDVPCNNKKPRPFGVAISVVDAIDAAGVTTTIDRVEEP
ncbi:MAG TPA: hypothetical protein VHM48_13170 [Candidatus Limnocylindrales bacterium]|nr:hypothetical protein [Candidatus Limnocylindrales bacterium]